MRHDRLGLLSSCVKKECRTASLVLRAAQMKWNLDFANLATEMEFETMEKLRQGYRDDSFV